MAQRVALAYSGGLDTSVIAHWLRAQGYEVLALCVNVGQQEDWAALREKALASGAVQAEVVDVRERFVSEFVFPAMQFHALYEGVYLLGTSLARPLIAQELVRFAQREGAAYVAHGATGKGNDQVRFELSCAALDPSLRVIAPWKRPEFFQALPGRKELIAYAEAQRIPVKATLHKPWSSDENLMHVSYEAGMLEDPWDAPRRDMFTITAAPEDAPEQARTVLIEFRAGLPLRMDGEALPPVALLETLNRLAGEHGVGRVDLVESRFVGMKSRGVYETPGGTVLHIAHRAMESITLDRDTIALKDSLMPRFARIVYEGFWFTAELRALLALLRETQAAVTGEVRLSLYRGGCQVTGRRSPYSLYDSRIASMEDDQGAWQPQDAEGFIRLHGLPLRMAYHQRQQLREHEAGKPAASTRATETGG